MTTEDYVRQQTSSASECDDCGKEIKAGWDFWGKGLHLWPNGHSVKCYPDCDRAEAHWHLQDAQYAKRSRGRGRRK